MHLLELYSLKDEHKNQYWISKKEAESIFDQVNDKKPFVTVARLSIAINPREIKSFGVPKYISDMTDQGFEVLISKRSKSPYLQFEDGYQRCIDGVWEQKMSTRYDKIDGLTFDDFIKSEEVKRLN